MSNGDAHYKNFSLIETSFGDFRLSPAYDLLNSSIHINDSAFALDDGLLPPKHSKGKIKEQFFLLAEMAGIPTVQSEKIMQQITLNSEKVKLLIHQSFLSDKFKRNYEQAYLTRLKKLRSF
jgi:serine/threonine-protein kinase HipA